MQRYLIFVFQMLLFRRSPQEVPVSAVLLAVVVSLFLISGLWVNATLFSFTDNILRTTLDTALLLLFVHFLLQFRGHPERFSQTVIALCIVFILINMIAWPAMQQIAKVAHVPDKSEAGLAAMFVLGLFIYSIFIMGHILRHALSSSFIMGLLASFAYACLNILLLGLVFPDTGV